LAPRGGVWFSKRKAKHVRRQVPANHPFEWNPAYEAATASGDKLRLIDNSGDVWLEKSTKAAPRLVPNRRHLLQF
jgi:hypothetical protein